MAPNARTRDCPSGTLLFTQEWIKWSGVSWVDEEQSTRLQIEPKGFGAKPKAPNVGGCL